MALDFSCLPPEKPLPDGAPSRVLWLAVFIVLTAVGVLAVLMLWPEDEPTHTPWFWVCVSVYPTVFSAFFVSRRYRAYELERANVQAWNDASRKYNAQAFARESVPMLVLATAARVTADDTENGIDRIVDGTMKLRAKASAQKENEAVSARWLDPIEARLAADDRERHEEVLEWLYERLLNDLKKTLHALPADLPMRVLLDISGYVGESDLMERWRKKWRHHKLRVARMDRAPESLGLMAVDSWLDDPNGPLHQHAVLLISVVLNRVIAEPPPPGSAEAGVGMLLVSEALASRFELRPIAALHRPRRAGHDDLDHALTYGLRWGSAEPDAIGALWMSGFDSRAAGSLRTALSAGRPVGESDEAVPEFELDRIVGMAGASAGWLAAACAIHMAGQSPKPQLVAQRDEDHMSVAVVTNVDNASTTYVLPHEPDIQT
ncbi:hypothetical protein [Burkholderia sp. LA-2-3-30-S1-D2]|uniref:hypothetical protein n=1 Tax=Burkholderia sp. LA-2-3-30-S1-D2 TaxID=1637862 RepID=UPI0007571C33|nr:hypothetical protein [Burkholderia sp. LA-2-3-30-S1-D2]AOI95818.1 hypothetical protein WS66_09385 [Burkholderia sp. LA-2-3-30-S1-D2]KVE16240.1 hypothetical protein WS66_07615 [Burkholderia sp. LA-2-3-30-S1-D2]